MHDAESPTRLLRSRSVDLRWAANTGPTVIVVDESLDELERAQLHLHVVGITARTFRRGSSALVAVGRDNPDAALIAADVTDLSCSDWVRAAREASQIPILVGVRNGLMDMVNSALMAGATAVVEYPFSATEIAEELQREWEGVRASNATRRHLHAGPLELDAQSFSATLNGRELSLTFGAFELLWCLMLRANRVVSPDEISGCLGRPAGSPRSAAFVKTQVARLRAEVGDRSVIRTVRGQGYTVRHLLHESSVADPSL